MCTSTSAYYIAVYLEHYKLMWPIIIAICKSAGYDTKATFICALAFINNWTFVRSTILPWSIRVAVDSCDWHVIIAWSRNKFNVVISYTSPTSEIEKLRTHFGIVLLESIKSLIYERTYYVIMPQVNNTLIT